MGFELDYEQLVLGQSAGLRIKVVGIGRFGCLAVDRMAGENLQGVEYVAMHSDPRVLLESKASIRLRIGGGAVAEREQKKAAGPGSAWRR